MITFKFETEEEKNAIIMENREKKLSKVMYLKDGNFLVFEEMPFIYELENKISILTEENENLKQEQEQQNEEILVNMLANTEMFEMLLGMIPMTLSKDEKNTKNSGGSSMIEVYCTLIIKGVKTIEDVPLVIREQVIERLKQLEVPVK